MSRVYFDSEHGSAEVKGPERHYAGMICNELLLATLPIHESGRPSPLRRAVASTWVSTAREGRFAEALRTWVCGGSRIRGPSFVLSGRKVDVFTCALNTARVVGSDAVKLLARLHGQCEIHCYVEGRDRNWLAGIIERGRRDGVLRAEMGWESVMALLRSRPDEPVVCSYSVTDSFPNRSLAERAGLWERPEDDEYGDTWYDVLPKAERWRLGLAALRQENGTRHLRLDPATWDEYRFGDGVSGFDVARWCAEQEQTQERVPF